MSTSTPAAGTKQPVASLLGVDLKPLAAFETHVGTVTLWQASGSAVQAGAGPAQLGLPITSEGVPDFNAIVAAGGKVTGARPPTGARDEHDRVRRRRRDRVRGADDRGDGSPPMSSRVSQ